MAASSLTLPYGNVGSIVSLLEAGQVSQFGVMKYTRRKAKAEVIIWFLPWVQKNIFFKTSELSYQKSHHPEVKILSEAPISQEASH